MYKHEYDVFKPEQGTFYCKILSILFSEEKTFASYSRSVWKCKNLNTHECKKHRNEMKIDILLRMSLSASILKELFLWEKQNILLFHTKSKPAASVCTHTHEQ